MTNEQHIENLKRLKTFYYINCLYGESINAAVKALEQPKTGHWISKGKGDGFKNWNCSKCEMLVRNSQRPWYKYCPNCGAKMVEPQERSDKE